MEKKILRVLGVYIHLMGVCTTNAKEEFGIVRNTLNENLKGNHHPKLQVLLDIFFGLFPDWEGRVFPDALKGASRFLTPDELDARIFATCLDDDAERMKSVAELLVKLADKEIPPFSELDALWEKEKSDKKKNK